MTSRVRVARVIARLNLGGPAHQAAMLSGRRMAERGYESVLIHGTVPQDEGSMADAIEREDAQSIFLPSLRQPIDPHQDSQAFRTLVKIFRDFRPHIVHTHTAKAGFVGRAAAVACAWPRPIIVHTFHGHVLEGYFGGVKSFLYRRLEQGLGRTSDTLIGVSQSTVDDLVRIGVASPDKFRVVPLGLELRQFADVEPEDGLDLRKELGLDPDRVLLTFVGRLAPIKRVKTLLHGFAQAHALGLPLHLAIVGDGSCRTELEVVARDLHIDGAVDFLGYRRDLREIAAASDIAVLSSANEGTPVALIEAGAAGTPAIASDVGGVAEVVRPETGVLFPPGDTRALGQAIADLTRDPSRRHHMGVEAREWTTRQFSIDRLLADIDGLYGCLLSRRESLGEA